MIWRFGSFRLDRDRFELSQGGQPVRLEPQVLALLVLLIENRHRLVSKDEVAAAIWPGRVASDASISSRIRSARQALGDDGAAQAVIRTVHGLGFRFVAEVAEAGLAPAEAAPAARPPEVPGSSRPSIAVLPFRPLGLPEDLAILADAIPHEIIQALSRLRWLAVIARGSTFRFRQAETDLDLVAATLGARYVLSGSVEARGGGLAVTLEMADASHREVIWGDRFVAKLDEIEELRARIVAQLISALEVYVPQNEARTSRLSGIDRLDAWAHYHLGLQHLYRFTAADNLKARGFFDQAVALDPRMARAHAGLSFTSFLEAFLHLSQDDAAAIQAARRHAERGVELDPLDPFANFTLGRSYWLTDEPETALGWLERATHLNPNYAQGFYATAFTSMLIGKGGAVEAGLDRALQLSPIDPLLYGFHGVRSQMLIQAGAFQAAADWGDRAFAAPGAHYLIGMIALAANSLAGRQDQAGRLAQEIRRRKADAKAAHYFAAFPTRDAPSRALIAGALRGHGF